MPNLSTIIVLGLVCWRITSLIVDEGGPYNIFAKIRKLIGVYYDEWSVRKGRNEFAKGLTCIWCASIWVAFFVATAYLYGPGDNVANIRTWQALPGVLGTTLAVSAVSVIFDSIVSVVDRLGG